MEGTIIWRRDWDHIAIGGMPVGEDRSLYSISREIDDEHHARMEKLPVHLSGNITVLALEQESMFLCENQGFQSQHISLCIPGKTGIKKLIEAFAITHKAGY